MKKNIAVIGLGQFGQTLIEELSKHDVDLIAIDSDAEKVRKISNLTPSAFVIDATDEKALKEIDISSVDNAVVAFGNNIQSTILTTVMLKETGVKHITVRVDDEYYVPIIKRLGADEVLSPQRMAAVSFANRLENSSFVDYYSLEDDFSVVKIKVNEDYKGEVLSKIDPRNKFNTNLILINRNDKSFAPKGTDQVLAKDIIIVVGKVRDIEKLERYFNK